MKDSIDLSLISYNPLSSLKRYCINEINIRNHSYIVSMCIQTSEQIKLEIKVQEKETADQWKSSFHVNGNYFIHIQKLYYLFDFSFILI